MYSYVGGWIVGVGPARPANIPEPDGCPRHSWAVSTVFVGDSPPRGPERPWRCRRRLGVGIGPAIISTVTTLLSLPSVLGVGLALAVDAGAIHLLYRQPRRTTALITAIHAIVTVILGAVVGGAVILYLSAPA